MKKVVLDRGPVLLVDTVPSSASVSIGLWLNVGSRDEIPGEHGFSHFTEHMLFKGTRKRSGYDIGFQIDRLGGEINGVTGKENTDYYINVAWSHYETALDVLLDMFFNAAFDKKDFDIERFVILSEMEMSNDDPEESANDLFSRSLWGDDSLGLPVVGIRPDIERASVEKLFEYYRRHYSVQNLIVSAAGRLTIDDCRRSLEHLLDTNDYPSASPILPERVSPEPVKKIRVSEREIEQVYFICGTDTYGNRDEERFPLMLLNTIIGGSISSRLFQNIREKQGLCYSIGSNFTGFTDCGEFTIYFSSAIDTLPAVLDLMVREIRAVKNGGIGTEDLKMAKERFFGSYILASESAEWKMVRMALQEILYGRIIPFDETLDKIEHVSLDDLYETAASVLQGERFTCAGVGPRGLGNILDAFSFDF